jgi:hypothetical protein
VQRLAFCTGSENLNLSIERAGCVLHIAQLSLALGSFRIYQRGHLPYLRKQLMKQPRAFLLNQLVGDGKYP